MQSLFHIVAGLALFGVSLQAHAAEVDNYSTDQFNAADVTALFNDKFNHEVEILVQNWRKDPPKHPSRALAVRRFYSQLSGNILRGQWDLWYQEAQPSHYHSNDSLYKDLKGHVSELALRLHPPVDVVVVNSTPIGIDKMHHFIDMGFFLYRYVSFKGRSEDQALQLAALTERTILGIGVIGIYSNADMVANYEGYLLFRGLVEDNVIPGKKAVIAWDSQGLPYQQRSIDLKDHVNSYWNEVMNPSWFVPSLRERILNKLPRYCSFFEAHPEYYLPVNETELQVRYRELPLRPSPLQRLDAICTKDVH